MTFEQGPIRPPSEAASLLIRVSRNCPWNGCTFCPVYKGRDFSKRTTAEVMGDIDEVAAAIDRIRAESWRGGQGGAVSPSMVASVMRSEGQGSAMQAAAIWLWRGQGTVFLQDADPLAMRTEDLEKVLRRLGERLQGITRVTAYARSATLASRGAGRLRRLEDAGLDRVHVGVESGSDRVVALVRKGATHGLRVRGGRAASGAGLELPAYVMPGLGGVDLSVEHAEESARCIAEIGPHFTRLRSLAVTDRAPLTGLEASGAFRPLGDDAQAKEVRLFVERLVRDGARTALRSDHILNLIGDLDGDLPGDGPRLLGMVDAYLDLPAAERRLYRLGRRAGLFSGVEDLGHAARRVHAEAIAAEVGDYDAGVDAACRDLVSQWI